MHRWFRPSLLRHHNRNVYIGCAASHGRQTGMATASGTLSYCSINPAYANARQRRGLLN
jgi:hypothetical protein